MNSKPIMNREGKVLGRWDAEWLLDGQGKPIARYDATANLTRDAKGRIVGPGDQRLRELGNRQKKC
jgi:hypothetical protein